MIKERFNEKNYIGRKQLIKSEAEPRKKGLNLRKKRGEKMLCSRDAWDNCKFSKRKGGRGSFARS